jgi:hypothetical protein
MKGQMISLSGGIDLAIELDLLLLEHLLQDLGSLRLAVSIVQVSFIDSLQKQMDLLWGFRPICIKDALYESLDYVSQMTLHRRAFF